MGIAKDILKRLSILANEIPSHLRDKYFRPLLPSLVMLCQTFPPLCTETTKFLVSLRRECMSDEKMTRDAIATVAQAQGYSRGGGARSTGMSTEVGLVEAVRETFQEIVTATLVNV